MNGQNTTWWVLGGLAGIGTLAVWRSGRRAGVKARRGAREITRMTGNAVRTLVTAALIVAIQYAALLWVKNTTVTAIVLIVPGLLAGSAVARLLAVTEIVDFGGRHHR
ncbi:hypothetical protein [Amycolatopsis suaedae]|uniref:Uncharacterized protein n=1 Tax=Amycolatopsis suaedae TaxID=2510978 RepID=A0A4Q7JAW8_9PSEU|nr:hypothetical protein [Amycolatopsis suaedae]RZQ64208.1 hypothetical protein EWH70_09490 [Amycolatopsis suaedae]